MLLVMTFILKEIVEFILRESFMVRPCLKGNCFMVTLFIIAL